MRLARILPAVAIGFVAVVILGPGNARPVLGARVYVSADTMALRPTIASARITAAWRLGNAETPAAGVPIEVLVGGNAIGATTGPDGVAEIAFEPRVEPGTIVDVVSEGRSIATGPLGSPERAQTRPRDPGISGRREGMVHIAVRALRGQLAPPFPETIVVDARAMGSARIAPSTRVHVTAELTGASPARFETDVDPEQGYVTFEVRPEAMRVDIDVNARTEGGQEGTFSGSFNTVPGAMWVDPKSPADRIDLVAPAPRKAAYVSFISRLGRVGGATAQLHEDADGFYRGSVPRPTLPDRGSLDLVVAGDPEEHGDATVIWPFLPAPSPDATPSAWVDENLEETLPVRLTRIIDGMSTALVQEQDRIARVRRLAVAVAAFVGLLEIALLFLEGRRAQRDLDAHFAAQADAADGVEASAAIRDVAKNAAKSGSVMVTILGAMIALAFGIVAAFVVAR